MSNILIAIWLVIYGAMALVTTKVPEWIVPSAAIVIGLMVLAGGLGWRSKN